MAAEQTQNELTTTLHLGVREVSNSPANYLEEQLALMSPEDRAVLAEIQNSDGQKAMIVIARGAHKGSRFLITAEGVSIGRSGDNAIFLDDITVSRTHATIAKNGASFVLKDYAVPTWKAHMLIGSRQGTWSLHVTRNWRLTFWVDGNTLEIIDLDFEDYH